MFSDNEVVRPFLTVDFVNENNCSIDKHRQDSPGKIHPRKLSRSRCKQEPSAFVHSN
jgi:hypothetical protein